MRVLLIASVGLTVVSRLSDTGTVAMYAEDADKALSLLGQDSYNLVLLDMSMSAPSGLDLIRRIRQSGDDTPLLALTGKVASERAKALDLGADDAVAEPVEAAELCSRVNAITRRQRGLKQSLVQVGDLSLCLVAREARFGDVLVPLTGMEFSLLELVVQRRGEVVTKTTILSRLYGDGDGPEAKIIDVIVCKLRRKLERAGAADLIGTAWGQGYVMRDPALPRRLAPAGDIRIPMPPRDPWPADVSPST